MTWPTRNNSSRGDAQPPKANAGPLLWPGWLRVVLIAVYLLAFAIAARLLVSIEDSSRLAWYLALLAAFFALFSLVWFRPRMRPLLLHLIFVIQCLIILALLALKPEFDYVTVFFALLSYQTALVFQGRIRWVWVVTLVVLIAGSLMIILGPARGLGLGLANVAALAIAFPALALASQDIEAARTESRKMVDELEATHRRLEKYAAEVNDLAVVEERNRLARELHDSVSQAMFSILLATRSAQIMQEKEPEGVQAQLEQLQELTRDALARMREFIADLRPKLE